MRNSLMRQEGGHRYIAKFDMGPEATLDIWPVLFNKEREAAGASDVVGPDLNLTQ